MTQKCPDCASEELIRNAGDGKCKACYGSGKVGTIANDIVGGKPNCLRCKGSGKCQTCRGEGTLVARAIPPRPYANAELNPFDDKVAIRTTCPKCGALDWFEWKFLGKLTDPVCGHLWYADSGIYTVQQLRATGQLVVKMNRYMNNGISGEGAWIAKLMGGFLGLVFGVAFRLPYGLLMIPIQAVVRTSQSRQPSA